MSLPVRSPWFRTEDAGLGITRFVEPYVNTMLESNVWHVRGSERDLLIDTGNGVGLLGPELAPFLESRPLISVVTHGHFDHTGGLAEFEDRRCHRADADEVREPYAMTLVRDRYPEGIDEMFAFYGYELPDLLVEGLPREGFDPASWTVPGCEPTAFLEEGEVLDLGDRRVEVLHVPGHTPGSIALYESETGVLFTGDTVYVDDRLSFDDPGSSSASLGRLAELQVTVMHGGHGRSVDGDGFREAIQEAERQLSSGA